MWAAKGGQALNEALKGPEGCRPQARNALISKSSLFHQDSQILDCCNEPVLDLYFPQTTPPCSLEAMVVARIGEAAFHFMAASAITDPSLRTLSLGFCRRNQIEKERTTHHATGFGAG